MGAQIDALAGEVTAGLERHPHAKVIRSLLGLGTILGACVLGGFGDEPSSYAKTSAWAYRAEKLPGAARQLQPWDA